MTQQSQPHTLGECQIIPPPPIMLTDGPYVLRFANNAAEMDGVFRLRYEIFNVELGEGLAQSHITGRDIDRFDAACHNMLVVDKRDGRMIGTYRLQTLELATLGHGFYSGGEFNLDDLPHEVLAASVELGRACIAKDHRDPRVLYLMWRGIAAYLTHFNKRYFFGCCSLTSQDPCEGKAIMQQLQRQESLHSEFCVQPQPSNICYTDDLPYTHQPNVHIPRLFAAYLRFGAKVCGPPAIDREFKTIDYFVLFDMHSMSDLARKFFM